MHNNPAGSGICGIFSIFRKSGVHAAASCYFRDGSCRLCCPKSYARQLASFSSIISIMRIDAAVSPERHALPVRLASKNQPVRFSGNLLPAANRRALLCVRSGEGSETRRLPRPWRGRMKPLKKRPIAPARARQFFGFFDGATKISGQNGLKSAKSPVARDYMAFNWQHPILSERTHFARPNGSAWAHAFGIRVLPFLAETSR